MRARSASKSTQTLSAFLKSFGSVTEIRKHLPPSQVHKHNTRVFAFCGPGRPAPACHAEIWFKPGLRNRRLSDLWNIASHANPCTARGKIIVETGVSECHQRSSIPIGDVERRQVLRF